MQLDLFNLISAEDEQVQRVVEEERLLQTITKHREALGWDEYEKIKAERSLNVDIDSLPWIQLHPNISTSGYEHCDIKVIIPPDALSYMEYYHRVPSKKRINFNDPVSTHYHEVWAAYTMAVWKYKPHNVDWTGAYEKLSKHRDNGDPIWIRLSRQGGKLAPDCIIEIAGLHPVLNI